MNKIEQLTNGTKKIPRCVAVYNKLFQMIKDGEFVQDSRLPTEPELAKTMGVSRTTLRQALAFLQEDGIIKNMQGKGNFVMKSGVKIEKGIQNRAFIRLYSKSFRKKNSCCYFCRQMV